MHINDTQKVSMVACYLYTLPRDHDALDKTGNYYIKAK